MTGKKTVLITGSTDGIGLETARHLIDAGCTVILHGRSPEKLENARKALNNERVSGLLADLSTLEGARGLAEKVIARAHRVDVLINNAGVFSARNARTG